MCDSIHGSLCPSPMKIHESMWIQWPFFKNLNQRSLIPRWPLIPHLLRSHVWLYLRIIVSKSYGNTSIYEDTLMDFAKYHTHTTYTGTYYVQNWSHVSFWTKFRWDNKMRPWSWPRLAAFHVCLPSHSDRSTYAPNESRLFWSQENPNTPNWESQARLKMAQVLGSLSISVVYIHH